MDLHERQQFDFLLVTAVERFVERLEQRNEGAANALARLRADPEQTGVGLTEFVRAVFNDFLLGNPDGACFVLRALPRRRVDRPAAGTVEEVLMGMAAEAFGGLLKQKTEERLEQHAAYSPH
ncbi:hypothetical protein [Frigoriglobus tundricola]|uniref:Uncharacterized protein n=1 Tax=Frigoriglobus tundricola TaxID=2774151 RepID=A0A6M5YP01_9BACT|nr:hypothetical protein [Frigoriglobus tundricola]QJW94961.1 hypothetical protein FTUN_2487 [Frigoriglobus tundricola]